MRLSRLFGPVSQWPDQDLIALTAEFDGPITIEAYTAGAFPMPLHDAGLPEGVMGWWSPVHRGVLPLADLRVTRSLRQSAKHYEVTFDRAFAQVIKQCGDPRRPDGWIDPDIVRVYSELHGLGLVHSVEAWTPSGELAGGLYGVSIGGLFAGESMFHDATLGRDASKVALMRLVEFLDDGDERRLLDVQWVTPHLASLGAVEVDRVDYLRLLGEALDVPMPDWGAVAEGSPHA